MEIQLSDAKCKSVEILSNVELLKSNPDSEAKESFKIKAYTGQVIDRYWGKLAIALDGMSAKSKLPIFRGHFSGAIVGHSTKAYVDGPFYVEGKFSKATEAARETKELAEEGFPWQASIGVRASKVMRLGEGETEIVNGKTLKGPAEIWLKSNVFETSFVTFGADNKTSVETFSKFEEQQAPQGANHNPQEDIVDKLTLKKLEKEAPELLAEIQTAAKASGYDEGLAKGKAEGKAEHLESVTAILAVEDADLEAKTKAIQEGLTVEAAYKLFFEAEKGKKAEALKALENGEKPAGQKAKTKTETGKTFMGEVDAYQTEHKCKRTEAVKAVQKKEPELHAASISGKEGK